MSCCVQMLWLGVFLRIHPLAMSSPSCYTARVDTILARRGGDHTFRYFRSEVRKKWLATSQYPRFVTFHRLFSLFHRRYYHEPLSISSQSNQDAKNHCNRSCCTAIPNDAISRIYWPTESCRGPRKSMSISGFCKLCIPSSTVYEWGTIK